MRAVCIELSGGLDFGASHIAPVQNHVSVHVDALGKDDWLLLEASSLKSEAHVSEPCVSLS